MTFRTVAVALLAMTVVGAPDAIAAGARELYTSALGRERALRTAERPPTLRQYREIVAAYERLVRRYPRSGYSDNALWQASNLALLAYQRFGQPVDRATGLRLLKHLKTGYPSSSLLSRVDETVAAFERRPAVPGVPAARSAGPERGAGAPTLRQAQGVQSSPKDAGDGDGGTGAPVLSVAPTSSTPEAGEPPTRAEAPKEDEPNDNTIRSITRAQLGDGVRVTIEMDKELLYRQERLEKPSRVFFDLRGARPIPNLVDATLKYAGEPVPEIRLGRHPQNTTRVVMDMAGVDSYTVFTLYNPFRLVIDFHRSAAHSAPVAAATLPPPAAIRPTPVTELKPESASAPPSSTDKKPLASRPAVTTAPVAPPPTIPMANSNGQFSLSRQLGLGVSRIVIDAGHGGHDPGAKANGVTEAELVLDVAQRLRQLLAKQPGVEVVMTRSTDVFIPLEERTAIANREAADLFLSIHANASRNSKARGVETYFLNFASNPEAAAVAARENSASGRSMHSLPDIVRAITLSNKIDESRDFASMIQKSMVRRLTARNAQLRDLGVKQAPFVVLIGAGMPSVLAEISFVTHKQEAQLLKTPAYRQHIADALLDAVVQYQKSLKARSAIAMRE